MTTTTRAVLSILADRAEQALQPPGRGAATAATLRELGELDEAENNPLTLADAWAGLWRLACPRDGGDERIAARRRTCGELAELITRDEAPASDDLADDLASFQIAWMMLAWGIEAKAVSSAVSSASIVRLMAIGATMRREVFEIGEARSRRANLDELYRLTEEAGGYDRPQPPFSRDAGLSAPPTSSAAKPPPLHVAEAGPALIQLGQRLYEAYTDNSGNLNYRGEPCPAWDALGDAVQSHWCAAASRSLSVEYLEIAYQGRRLTTA